MSFSLQKGSKDRELQLSNSGMRVQRTLVVSGECMSPSKLFLPIASLMSHLKKPALPKSEGRNQPLPSRKEENGQDLTQNHLYHT